MEIYYLDDFGVLKELVEKRNFSLKLLTTIITMKRPIECVKVFEELIGVCEGP